MLSGEAWAVLEGGLAVMPLWPITDIRSCTAHVRFRGKAIASKASGRIKSPYRHPHCKKLLVVGVKLVEPKPGSPRNYLTSVKAAVLSGMKSFPNELLPQ